MSAVVVFCTCPDPATAEQLASLLVEQRLAACVSRLGPVHSTYRWQGKIEQDDEIQLLIKTTQGCLAALTETLRQAHPYELPEIIAVPVSGGLSDYLEWISTQCEAEPHAN